MKTKFVYIFFTVLYLILFLLGLNFNFIEGDDASTVMYHLLDRQQDLQKPYSAYHSMFDSFLSLFDANNEKLLRYISIGISFLFGLLTLLSLAKLVLLKSKNTTQNVLLVLVLLPFIIPEILFGSLIVNATLISITCILVAHIFMLKYLNSSNKWHIFLAILCFGIGVSFRWNNGFYLFILFGDYILLEKPNIKQLFSIDRLKKSLTIFPLFIVSVLVFIQISGYSILEIINTYTEGSSYVENMETSYAAMFASAITFLTPALLLLLILGCIYSYKNKAFRPLFLLLFALIPFLVIGLYPSYKYMISILPILVLIAIQGFSLIHKKPLKIAVILVVFLPWIIGIQLDANSAWGPGFEVKLKTNSISELGQYNPDKSIDMDNIKMVLGSGMAMPTPEGPRPIFGFGNVVLNDWKQFIENNNAERLSATQYAIDNTCNILQDVRHSLIGTKLIELGYTTHGSFQLNASDIYSRNFFNDDNSIVINVMRSKNELFNPNQIEKLKEANNCFVVYSTYTNIISKLQSLYGTRFEQKGAYWGILKLD